jgi:hypothetical protein
VELISGTFSCNFSGSDDKLITPTAEIVFKKNGGFGLFDLYQGNLYCNPMASESINTSGEIEFTNRKTKKKFTVKRSNGLCEIIVAGGAIYKKSFLKLDKFFLDFNIASPVMKPEMLIHTSANLEVGNYKDIGKAFEQGMSNLDMFTKLSPEDLERLMTMNGEKISADQKKQLKELPELMKKMEREGVKEGMEKASAMIKGMGEGIGEAGAESMKRMQADSSKEMEKLRKQSFDMYKKAGKTPRDYAPLSAEYKVA